MLSVKDAVSGLAIPTILGRLFNTSSKLERTVDKNFIKKIQGGLPPREVSRTKILSDGGITLVFDAVDDISSEFPSRVTSFPVEDGADISDHVINGNPTFTVSGIYSDYNRGLNTESDLTEDEFYQGLLNIRDNRQTVSLLTPRDTYVDLILTAVSFPIKQGDGLSLKVNVSFEKIRRVSNELTTVFVDSQSIGKNADGTAKGSPKKGDTKTKAAEEVDKGVTPATPANRSIIKDTFFKAFIDKDKELKEAEEALKAAEAANEAGGLQ